MVSSTDKDLFTCNGCGDDIGSERARILCNICVDFNLCSNCYVLNYASKTHKKSHSTSVFRTSGYVNSENSNALTLLQTENSGGNLRKPSQEIERKYSEIPTANWGALWNVMKAPLTKKDKRASKSTGKPESGTSLEARNKNDSLSPLSRVPEPLSSLSVSTKSQVTPVYPGPTYFRPDKWEPFFESDNTPSSIFVGLMSSIFNTLDEKGTGYLKPEEFSFFLEIQGYPLSANIWKMAWQKAAGGSSKDVADLELGLYFAEREIPFTLAARPIELETSGGNSPEKPLNSKTKKKNSKDVNKNMPLLSRQGFIDLSASEYLKDPSMAYQYIMNALHELKVWKELGDLPRSVLPIFPMNNQDQDQEEEEDSDISILIPNSKENESSESENENENHQLNKNQELILLNIDKEGTKSESSNINTSENEPLTPVSIDKSVATPIVEDTGNQGLTAQHLRISADEPMTSLFIGKPGFSLSDGDRMDQKSAFQHRNNSENESMSPTFVKKSELTLTGEDKKNQKSSFQHLKTSVKEPLSPRFVVKFQDNSCEPTVNLNTKIIDPKNMKSSRLLQNKHKLVVKTDFPNQWLSTASALSARSPQRRKVEMLVEAYEFVRANSICLDERPVFKSASIYKNTST
ncbi:hypothetical protein HI914_05072 [Erysiphe necator]|nr:hypothetical protein HI914_05072 [Erysiphe necator]